MDHGGAIGVARRGFLARIAGRRPGGVRPPWAVAEAAFVAVCTRCGDCVGGCRERLLVAGSGGFPEVDFSRGGCTFCGDCAAACRSGALARPGRQAPWRLRAAVGDGCLARAAVVCRACGDACEVGALTFAPQPGGVATPAVNQAACSGCGACVAPCPTGAMRVAEPANSSEGAFA